MKKIETKFKDCFLIDLISHIDDRGYFQETFHLKKYADLLPEKTTFVQDNLSKSKKGVIRGIHFQNKNSQGKLIRVVAGEVFDVAVDLRLNSSTFGKYHSEILSEKNSKQFWIPEGFGHGFMTLSDHAVLEYKCTNFYDPKNEHTLLWNDQSLKIRWPRINPIILSEKDKLGLDLNSVKLLLNH